MNVCVYCASSDRVDATYVEMAKRLGRLLGVKHGIQDPIRAFLGHVGARLGGEEGVQGPSLVEGPSTPGARLQVDGYFR